MPKADWVAQKIREYIAEQPEGALIATKELQHLGSRAAINQALSRLAKYKQIMHIRRGLYAKPTLTRWGPCPPSVESVVQFIASSTGEVVARHGGMIANALGLTTQMPIRYVYLTSGRSRRVRVRNHSFELLHAPKWQLMMPAKYAGDVIRAIAWFGEARIGESLKRTWAQVPDDVRQEIIDTRHNLPAWFSAELEKFM